MFVSLTTEKVKQRAKVDNKKDKQTDSQTFKPTE